MGTSAGWAQASGPDGAVQRLVALLAAAHPDVAMARAAAAAAEALVPVAGARAPAELGIEVEEIGGVSPQLLLGLTQDWGVGAERRARRGGALAAREAAMARLRLTEAQATAAAARELAAWLGWADVALRLAAEDSLLADAEEALRARFSVGTARYVDVLRVRTERVRVQVERVGAVRESARARALLLARVRPGFERAADIAPLLDSVRVIPDAVFALPPLPDPESLLVAAGGMTLLDARFELARRGADLLRVRRRPSLVTGLGLQRFSTDRGATVGPTALVSVSLPFSVGGPGRAMPAAADALVAAAGAERSAALARLRGGLTVARERYAAALERLRLVDAAVLPGVREEREAALGAFRTGELSLLELLDFERGLARVVTERRLAVMDAAAALADMYTIATGGDDPMVFSSGATDDR